MNLDRVLKLLASNIPPAQVATVVGVTPARISQLLKDEDFKLRLEAARAETELEDTEELAINVKYQAAEHAILSNILDKAPSAELRDLTAALRVVAERQDRLKTRLAPVNNGNDSGRIVNVVNITLPSHALPQQSITVTEQNEVISIGDKTLTPMTSDQVTKMFSSMKKGEDNEPKAISTSAEASSSEALPLADKELVTTLTEEVSFLEYAK